MIAPDGYHKFYTCQEPETRRNTEQKKGSREGELVGQSLQVYTIMTTGLKDLKEKITPQ